MILPYRPPSSLPPGLQRALEAAAKAPAEQPQLRLVDAPFGTRAPYGGPNPLAQPMVWVALAAIALVLIVSRRDSA